MGSETSNIHPGKEGSLCFTELNLFPRSRGSVGEEVAWSFPPCLGVEDGTGANLGKVLEGQVSCRLEGWSLIRPSRGLSTKPLALLPCLSFLD